MGLLSKGHLVETDRSGLVGGYVGQTAIKTQDVIQNAMGGILFIDEAYTLSSSKSETDYGQESIDTILKAMEAKYSHEQINTIDGLKIDFAENWVHLRKSNTEPIIRIYTEAKSQEEADALADRIIGEIKEVAGV